MSNLAGKNILITGASRGIGAAMARLAVSQGASVILHASKESPATTQLAGACGEKNHGFIFEDLRQAGAGCRVFGRALDMVSRIDGVINNAGVYLPSPLEGPLQDDERGAWEQGWADTLAVNVQAPADICREAVAHFRKTGEGSIVNIASRAGHRGDGPDHGAYAASKGAVLAMTKTWARALSGEGIHIYAIAPGWVETRMAPEDIANRKKAIAEIPLGRVADPTEIAELALFLISGACPSAVGATFDVNGASYVR